MSALFATAQGTLTGEVTVEREIVATEREATPLNMLPRLNLPALPAAQLDFSNRPVRARVEALTAFAEPARREDVFASDSWRGYASLFAGPLWNASLNAGYRLIDNRRTRLSAWVGYTGEVYRRAFIPDAEKIYWRDHDAGLGLNFDHDLGSHRGRLSIDAEYHFGRTNGYHSDATRYWVNTNRGRLSAEWHRAIDAFTLATRLHYSYFASNPISLGWKGTSQNVYGLSAKGRMIVSDKSRVGADIALDMSTTGPKYLFDPAGQTWSDSQTDGSSTVGLVTLTPLYELHNGSVRLSIGPRLQFTFNGDKFFHITPAVDFGWRISPLVALSATLTGGEHSNGLYNLYSIARRMVPGISYSYSHIPLDARLGVCVGPWKGAWVKLFGGWARANNWMMPTDTGRDITAIAFNPVDIKGFTGGVEVGYAWGTYLEASARWQTAPTGYGRGYYLWHDNARHVVDIKAQVRPIRQLTVSADWQWRVHRSLYTPLPFDLGYISENLHNASWLNLQASWAFSERLSVSLRAENLLNRHSTMIDATASRGTTVLAGASYRF